MVNLSTWKEQMMTETSTSYLPSGYILENVEYTIFKHTVLNPATEKAKEWIEQVDNAISDLTGIWKYSALSYHIKAKEMRIKNDIKKANEYGIQLRKMWDYLDQLSLDYVEKIAIELNGQTLADDDPDKKAVLTNIEDYLKVRSEQETNS